MNVLGNNIANVNTIGFKAQRMDFEDFIYQNQNTASGLAQVGRGVAIGTVLSDFGQGSFETTTEATDLAIGGKGFFQVKVKNSEQAYYTRAGNFRFDNDGYLVDPHGYVLQGWEIQSQMPNIATSSGANTSTQSQIKGTGVPKDIRLANFTSPPKHTQSVTVITNLDASTGGDNSVSATGNPAFALFETWDGQRPLGTSAQPALGETAYAYQNTIKVYDEGGASHNLTIYFDQVDMSNSGNNRVWEYMVTIDPQEDNRVLGGVGLGSSAAAGVLMVGTLTFKSTGELDDMSAFTLKSDAALSFPTGTSDDFKLLSNWQPTPFSTNHYPMFVANFTGASNASFVGATNAYNMELNLGLIDGDNAWDSSIPTSNAAMVGTDATNLPSMGTDRSLNSKPTTSRSGASSTLFQSQDGFTFGFLQSITVNRDGILQGRYSNGEVLDLYQVTLYDFQNKWGLNREGGNLYSQTRESGEASPGPANGNGMGTVQSNSLEQSNVDMAREFVNMITTQRGFQANSKVITTTDTLLGEVLQLKR
jgi:flagellar hook protein FlgE